MSALVVADGRRVRHLRRPSSAAVAYEGHPTVCRRPRRVRSGRDRHGQRHRLNRSAVGHRAAVRRARAVAIAERDRRPARTDRAEAPRHVATAAGPVTLGFVVLALVGQHGRIRLPDEEPTVTDRAVLVAEVDHYLLSQRNDDRARLRTRDARTLGDGHRAPVIDGHRSLVGAAPGHHHQQARREGRVRNSWHTCKLDGGKTVATSPEHAKRQAGSAQSAQRCTDRHRPTRLPRLAKLVILKGRCVAE